MSCTNRELYQRVEALLARLNVPIIRVEYGKHPRIIVAVNGHERSIGMPCRTVGSNIWRIKLGEVRRLLRSEGIRA